MLRVTVNGKMFRTEKGARLKEILEKSGDFAFPCGGKGLCGKCRINCPGLPPTDLDEKFLTSANIKEGTRIACDKKITSDISLSYTPLAGAKRPVRKLAFCNITVRLGSRTTDIGISDDELAEVVSLRNPLAASGGTRGPEEARSDNSRKLLLSAIAKTCVELFERYGQAKAETLAITGDPFYVELLTGEDGDGAIPENFLPAENIYVLPSVGGCVGGDVLAESLSLPENSLLVDCEDVPLLFYVGKSENAALRVPEYDYSEPAKESLSAGANFLLKNGGARICLYGEHADELLPVFEKLPFPCEKREYDFARLTKTAFGFRSRAKLGRQAERTRCIKPEEAFGKTSA